MTTARKPDAKPGQGTEDKDRRPGQPEDDRQVDETVEETFPASDPPSYSGITGAEPPPEEERRNGRKPG